MKAMMRNWENTFQTQLKIYQKKYEANVTTAIVEFSEALLKSGQEISATIVEALELMKENILRSQAQLIEHGSIVLQAIQTLAQTTHRELKGIVHLRWEDVYLECGNDYGTHHITNL